MITEGSAERFAAAITWTIAVLFFTTALVIAYVIPLHAQDALTFGEWSRLIAQDWHFHYPAATVQEYGRPLFYVLQGGLWGAIGVDDSSGRILSLLFSLLLFGSLVWLVREQPNGTLLLVAATFCWAGGSLFSRGSRLPKEPIMATGATLLCGGAFLALLGILRGEIGAFDPSAVSAKSVIATVYLFIFGSIVGFTAYLWLLRATTASRASTYAYVNPIVAVFLGWALADEPLTRRVFLASAVIVGAVALIIRHGGEDLDSVSPQEPDLACPEAPERLRA